MNNLAPTGPQAAVLVYPDHTVVLRTPGEPGSGTIGAAGMLPLPTALPLAGWVQLSCSRRDPLVVRISTVAEAPPRRSVVAFECVRGELACEAAELVLERSVGALQLRLVLDAGILREFLGAVEANVSCAEALDFDLQLAALL